MVFVEKHRSGQNALAKRTNGSALQFFLKSCEINGALKELAGYCMA